MTYRDALESMIRDILEADVGNGPVPPEEHGEIIARAFEEDVEAWDL